MKALNPFVRCAFGNVLKDEDGAGLTSLQCLLIVHLCLTLVRSIKTNKVEQE